MPRSRVIAAGPPLLFIVLREVLRVHSSPTRFVGGLELALVARSLVYSFVY